MRLVELTEDTWPALETLFAANRTVGGCWCVWFMRRPTEVTAGWGADNKAFLRGQIGAPLGLLALDGERPVGWVAVAPSATYPRLADPADDDTWAVTCFFVHRSARRQGLARELLDAAVTYAAGHGARVVEARPVDTEGARRDSGDLFHGTLAMFRDAGFAVVERVGARRALVRRELP